MFYSTSMSRTQCIETPCASALNRVRGMPFRWSLNPYRGCVHGCHYCYARATHPYLGLNADDDFETKIVVKTNMPEVLRQELGKRSWQRERVAIGTATDAYQPCEGRYHITRRILEALRDHETPASIVTKSTLILRDLDLLAVLAQGPGARVHFTITTLDRALSRLLEPGTPPPAQRLAVLRRLAAAGVTCGVALAPVLPGLTDAEPAIAAVADAARANGATAFWAGPLRLAPSVKEHYLGFLAETFPELVPRYERAYAGPNAPAAYRAMLDERIARVQQRYGFEAAEGATDNAGARQADSSLDANGDRARQLFLPL
jgi:DNA repair photolyase